MTGELIFLRPLEEMDAGRIVEWRNHPDVSSQMFSLRGPTLEEHQAWFQKYIGGTERKEFVICLLGSGEPIGTIGLSNINMYHGTAEYGILIGSSACRGKGYAHEASRLILEYAFQGLGLQKIALRVFSDNNAAIQLYERAGFEREGLLRREFRKDGVYRDVVMMAAFGGCALSAG